MKIEDLKQPRTIGLIVLGAAVLLWLLVLRPAQARFRARLMRLDPAEVQEIKFRNDQLRATLSKSDAVVLSESERREFLQLLAESGTTLPNHPQGGWTCFTTIITKTGQFYFAIKATSNNGTIMTLFSNGTRGWNMGTLRNDAIKGFVERVFSTH